MAGPEILTRGFVYVKENQDLLEETKRIAKEVIKIENYDYLKKERKIAQLNNIILKIKI